MKGSALQALVGFRIIGRIQEQGRRLNDFGISQATYLSSGRPPDASAILAIAGSPEQRMSVNHDLQAIGPAAGAPLAETAPDYRA